MSSFSELVNIYTELSKHFGAQVPVDLIALIGVYVKGFGLYSTNYKWFASMYEIKNNWLYALKLPLIIRSIN